MATNPNPVVPRHPLPGVAVCCRREVLMAVQRVERQIANQYANYRAARRANFQLIIALPHQFHLQVLDGRFPSVQGVAPDDPLSL